MSIQNKSKSKNRVITLDFDLWPKQMEAFGAFSTELLYGGSAGGGKSHLERVLSISWCLNIPGLQYYLFRRQYSDLQRSYIEGPTGYLALLGPLLKDGDVQSVAKEIRFPNGSKIYLCHCQYEKDVTNFGSFEFHVLNIAEAGEFTPFMINYLRSRVRLPEQFKQTIPERYLIPKEYWRNPNKPEYQFPRVFYTSNPIGPGKLFFKKNFVDGRKPGEIWRASDSDGGMLRQFIPARLNDNPSLDPVAYAAQLQGIGSKGYVDALLQGKWDSPIGAFFPQIDRSIHVLKPFRLPSHWPCFMGYDHGACGDGDPFSIGWYTVSDGTIKAICAYTGNEIPIQRDAVICYRRWNGRGLPKMSAKEIADGIHQREKEQVLFRVAGGDIMEVRGHGESIFSIFAANNIHFKRADNRRQNGWAQVDYRLSGINGYPLSFWFEECEADLESIGSLQHDHLSPGDVAPGDDHDADRHRYAMMTRPVTKDAVNPEDVDYRDKNRRATPEKLIKMIANKSKVSGLYGRK